MGDSLACAIGIRLQVMPGNVRTPGEIATLVACAAFERAGEPDDVHRLCRELARVEGRSPVAVRYWLARLWGDGLVELAGTRPTGSGWRMVEGEEQAA